MWKLDWFRFLHLPAILWILPSKIHVLASQLRTWPHKFKKQSTLFFPYRITTRCWCWQWSCRRFHRRWVQRTAHIQLGGTRFGYSSSIWWEMFLWCDCTSVSRRRAWSWRLSYCAQFPPSYAIGDTVMDLSAALYVQCKDKKYIVSQNISLPLQRGTVALLSSRPWWDSIWGHPGSRRTWLSYRPQPRVLSTVFGIVRSYILLCSVWYCTRLIFTACNICLGKAVMCIRALTR